MDVGTYRDRLKAIDAKLLIVETLKEFEPIFREANIKQIRKGKRSDGEIIGKYASPEYAKFKKTLSSYEAPDGVINLTVTKMFTDNIFAKVETDKILFDSTDMKKMLLESFSWWDEKVFGISYESLQALKNDICAKLVENYYKKMAA